MSEHICIVGGGVVGAMAAYHLSADGNDVTIVERDRFAAACSHGNCGIICPSHLLPLAQPGAVREALRSMLRPNAPFAIKPRASKAMLQWFWRFLRSCNERDMLRTAEELLSLLTHSRELYGRLLADEGIECEWTERGLLMVYDHRKGFDGFAPTAAMLRERFGMAAERLDEGALLALEPALKPGVAGAWHFVGDAHLRPDLLLAALRERLVARGVRIVEGAAAAGITAEGRRARALRIEGQPDVEADQFVVAMGAWTPFIERDLGLHVPIQPGKGYSITSSTPERAPRHPIIFEESHVAVTPMGGAFRIGSTMEFVGYDASIPRRRLDLLTDAARAHLDCRIEDDAVRETWFGWRPMVWDGKPLIGRAPALDNGWLAAGHGMLGLSMAPGTGQLVEDLVAGREPAVPAAAFAPERFLSRRRRAAARAAVTTG